MKEQANRFMTNKSMITGPTFNEMLHPDTIAPATRAHALRMKTEDPLDPINLFNITWKDAANVPYYQVLPKALTGVDANIVVLYGKEFPTGAHKVGAAYSVLPAEMSQERFDRIKSYGARVIATPGSESNVKEIYDKTWELRRDPKVRILNQFEVMGNYRFHYYVTGNTIVELAALLHSQGIGNGKVAAYCSAMGSAGTIAAGDRLKQVWPDHRIIGLEPVQCPTMYNNGYGSHDIQGIGDKHVTWIHNVLNMDAIMCIDDIECKKGLQLLTEPAGWETLSGRYGIPAETVQSLSTIFGISGVCNVLGAIKTAKFYGLGSQETVVTICTDAIDRYYSVMASMTECYGRMDETEAAVRVESIFHGQKTDWIREGTQHARACWHNLKYYTWVEQQGKTVEELDAQKDPSWWLEHQALVAEIDGKIRAARG